LPEDLPGFREPLVEYCDALERLVGFRGADVQPDNLASAVGVGGHGDYRGNRNAPTSTTVGVTRLAGPDFMIEIEAVAVVNS
jgi:hypothetical protein